MRKECVLIDDIEYKLIISFEDLDFDYYTDVCLKLYFNGNCIEVFKDNLLHLRNLINYYNINDKVLDRNLDENKLGILLNEYYRNIYDNKLKSDDIILDSEGEWIGVRYCIFTNNGYATWMYKCNGNNIIKITPIFKGFEEDDYIQEYKKFIKEYYDVFRKDIPSEKHDNMIHKILELYDRLL